MTMHPYDNYGQRKNSEAPAQVLDVQPDMFGGAGYETSARRDSVLAQRFGVPPFTVLETRTGQWQERKRQWVSLGIQSEIGRALAADGERFGDTEEYASVVRATGAAGVSRVPTTMAHITAGTAPEIAARFAAAGYTTSIFDPVLTELMYRWYVPQGGHVLDPFCGGSVRGIVAACLGYAYTGVDLRPEQVAANVAQGAEIVPDNPPTWLVGDSRDIAALAPGTYQGMLTCPPYGDLERYSDDPRDISTLAPEAFDAAYAAILCAAVGLLAPDTFATVVISNIRDRHGHYRDLVGLTHAAMAAAGAHLYNEAILVNAVGSLPVRAGKQFMSGRKLGRTHQCVLTYVKGSWKRAAAACNAGTTLGVSA